MSDASSSFVYVYGVVPVAFDGSAAPGGIDDASVSIERASSALAALVSRVSAERYAPELVEANVGDVDWIGPRARAHDAVLTWASDAGSVIPFPIFTLFRDLAHAREAIAGRAEELTAALERTRDAREYGVRLFVRRAELAAHAAELSPRIAELEAKAHAATPGQRYLLERKLDRERDAEVRELSTRVAEELLDRLRPLSRASTTVPPPRTEAGRDGAVLDAYFLVPNDDLDRFRAELGAIAERYAARGFRVEFTGPWPPYHFAGADR